MTTYENQFPADREANREYLLAAVDLGADALAAGRDESEQARRLSMRYVSRDSSC